MNSEDPSKNYFPFGMTEFPFAFAPDARFRYLSKSSRNIVDAINLSVDRGRGIFMVQGPPGSGKTMLARVLQANWINDTTILQGYAVVPVIPSERLFLQTLCHALGLATPLPTGNDEKEVAYLFGLLVNTLEEHHLAAKRTVLILDEAHLLTSRMLELLHALSNYHEFDGQLLQLILLARPQFADTVAWFPDLLARVAGAATLKPYSLEDAMGLLAHRVEVAGGEFGRIFSPETHEPLYQAVGGLPGDLCVCAASLLTSVDLARETAVGMPALERVLNEMASIKSWKPLSLSDAPSVPSQNS